MNRITLSTLFIGLILVTGYLIEGIAALPANALIPRKVLFGNADKTLVKLSPNGQYLSYLAPNEGVLNIWIAPANNLAAATAITHYKNRGIHNYTWAYNNRDILYSQDTEGNENYRLYQYNLKTKKSYLLTPPNGVTAHLLQASPSIANEVLITMNDRDKRYFDVYRLNLTTLEKKPVLKNENFLNIIADNNLQIRFVSFLMKNGDEKYQQLKEGALQDFITIPMVDSLNTRIMGFDTTNNQIYLLDSRNHNTAFLKSHNLLNGKEKILAESDLADVDILTSHPTKRTVQAVAINYAKTTYQVLDKSIKKDIDYLTRYNPSNLRILSRTLDDCTWLIAYDSDIEPIKYYKYDRQLKKVELLFSGHAELEKCNFLKMHPITIKSRDGFNLISYLTVPAQVKFNQSNKKANHTSPLIILVHGGPYTRDTWRFNSEHQWLANRGYAVLSINYRGSSGFGKAFFNASVKEWGRNMHHDLIDGVHWAIRHGITNKDTVAMMGGSYGGYATLVGMTMTPDVFACGIDLYGSSNLLTFLKNYPPYWSSNINMLKNAIGSWDTKAEREFLKQRSPLTFVANIKKPLFIAQGVHDPRVKQGESEQIVQAMHKANIPVIYALCDNEGHGFQKSENKITFYALAEYFLHKVLGGKVETIDHDIQNSHFTLNNQKKLNNKTVQAIFKMAMPHQQISNLESTRIGNNPHEA